MGTSYAKEPGFLPVTVPAPAPEMALGDICRVLKGQILRSPKIEAAGSSTIDAWEKMPST